MRALAALLLLAGCSSGLTRLECADVADVALTARSMAVEGVPADQGLRVLRQVYNGPGMDDYRRALVAHIAEEAAVVSAETPSQFSIRLLFACSSSV